MCKTKFLQMCSSFYYFYFSRLFSFITLYHLHCFLSSFLLLYLSFHLESVHHHADFPHFLHFHLDSRPRFLENSYFSSKTNTPLYYCCVTLGTKSLLTSTETSLVIWPEKLPDLKVPKAYNLWSISKNNEWMKCCLRFMSKRSTNCPKLYFFFSKFVPISKNLHN